MRPPAQYPSFPHAPGASYQPFYSSHYAQAYSMPVHQPNNPSSPQMIPNFGSNPQAFWCPPGHLRCSYKGCQFTGAPKILEIHMMDRHLIYPPGWDRRPKKPDWDADPSLKGKPIPIQGTNLILDKPEDLKAWLAERKKRWPTSQRVEDKKRKMDEAVARGQLIEPFQRGNKRQKTQKADERGEIRQDRGRGRGRGRGNPSRARARAIDSGWQGRDGVSTMPTEAYQATVPELPPATYASGSEDEDGSPEVVSSKVPTTTLAAETLPKLCTDAPKEPQRTSRPLKRPPQPRNEPHNPFASRPTLLHNLLLPEIRVTISNLSQAIRFLVDNDLLENVETTPGAAASNMIQVITDNHVSKVVE